MRPRACSSRRDRQLDLERHLALPRVDGDGAAARAGGRSAPACAVRLAGGKRRQPRPRRAQQELPRKLPLAAPGRIIDSCRTVSSNRDPRAARSSRRLARARTRPAEQAGSLLGGAATRRRRAGRLPDDHGRAAARAGTRSIAPSAAATYAWVVLTSPSAVRLACRARARETRLAGARSDRGRGTRDGARARRRRAAAALVPAEDEAAAGGPGGGARPARRRHARALPAGGRRPRAPARSSWRRAGSSSTSSRCRRPFRRRPAAAARVRRGDVRQPVRAARVRGALGGRRPFADATSPSSVRRPPTPRARRRREPLVRRERRRPTPGGARRGARRPRQRAGT